MKRRSVKSYSPGIWRRDELEETEQLTDKKDPERSFSVVFVHKNKRMLKQMLKTALKTSKQVGSLVAMVNPFPEACPPGFWTCSARK